MARYHFNIADGTEQPDPIGTELDTLQQVRHEALRFSGEVLREMGDEFWDDTEWKLTVTDNAGAKVRSGAGKLEDDEPADLKWRPKSRD